MTQQKQNGKLLSLIHICKWQLRQYQYADGTSEKVDSVFYNFQKGSFSAICLLRCV